LQPAGEGLEARLLPWLVSCEEIRGRKGRERTVEGDMKASGADIDSTKARFELCSGGWRVA
jgi:hypothetical protein